jgi:hypothetical protein
MKGVRKETLKLDNKVLVKDRFLSIGIQKKKKNTQKLKSCEINSHCIGGKKHFAYQVNPHKHFLYEECE